MALKQRILIVDDDENIAELISLYLTKECFETKIVWDGENALKELDLFKNIHSITLHKWMQPIKIFQI